MLASTERGCLSPLGSQHRVLGAEEGGSPPVGNVGLQEPQKILGIGKSPLIREFCVSWARLQNWVLLAQKDGLDLPG